MGQKTPFVIADYGAADGATSMVLMTKAIGITPNCPSYMKDYQNIFVTACGTSVPLSMPPQTVSACGFLVFCSALAQFTINDKHRTHDSFGRNLNLSDAIIHTLSTNDVEKAAFRERGIKDWEHFLLIRAKELVPGGQLLVVVFSVDAEGQYIGNSKYIKENKYGRMMHHWRKLKDDGIIDEEEHKAATFQFYFGTKEDYSAPLEAPDSDVNKAGLKLVSMDDMMTRCPFNREWLNSEEKGDSDAARKHANWFEKLARSYSYTTFESALSYHRSQPEKNAIIDRLFQSYEDEVAASPGDHGEDFIHLLIHIEK